MRFLTADILFPIEGPPVRNGVLALDDDGKIADLMLPHDPGLPEFGSIERFRGVLCPGFVNAHCHLELSHLKGVIPERTGLPAFLSATASKRDHHAHHKYQAQLEADRSMWLDGIQAVGDICNTDDTLEIKMDSNIAYHSFIEVYSFNPDSVEEVMRRAIAIAGRFAVSTLPVSIVPHAPYSVSSGLLQHIRDQQEVFPGTVSMHCQETESEDEMFRYGTGALISTFSRLGIALSGFRPNGKSSLRNVLPLLPDSRLMLVHNTFTSAEEMQWAEQFSDDIFWCTCPGANQYIESRVADVAMWTEQGVKVCVGTDSLASNHQLSVLEELKLLHMNFPSVPLAELLKMATLNGAEALNLEAGLGSFKKNKTPGVLLLRNTGRETMQITAKTTVQRII